MEIQLYNSLTKTKETFKSIEHNIAKVYACGPTVYSPATIGNFRANIFADILVRTLQYNGYKVEFVMNITDVGHLTDDQDQGEDKIEKGAKAEGKSAWEIAKKYTDRFIEDSKLLNLRTPDRLPRATDHIKEQIEMVEKLEKNGFTYQIEDGVYFDTSKLKDYGELAGQKLEDKEEGARVEKNSEKRNSTDFALWKFAKPNENRQMEWDSPWGRGFPGWHIECTAMSTKYLGKLYDIHTGGMDLKMVHHPNEIAQSQGANQSKEANYWMHSEFLLIDGGKMSKSLGNVYTVKDIQDKGINPLAYRYLVLTAHYRSKLNFTWESLTAASNALTRLYSLVREWETPAIGCKEYEEEFHRAINNDLDTSSAIATMWEMINDTSKPTSEKAQTLMKFDSVLGLNLSDYIGRPIEIPDEVKSLIDQRMTARKLKNWEETDKLRDEIKEKGFIVEDTSEGQKISEI